MEDRKKMRQSPGKPGASKQGKCLFMSSVFISVIRKRFPAVKANCSLRWILFFIFYPQYISSQYKCCLPCFAIIRSWNCVNEWIHAVLHQVRIYFDNLRYFPPPRLPWYSAVVPSICVSIRAIFCHLATKYYHKRLTYYNNKFPPAPLSLVIKYLLTGMKWKWWFSLAFSHQSGPSETWKLYSEIWEALILALRPHPLAYGFATTVG